jgi:DNA mismatch endonuclease (patch repair protein)
MAAIRSIDTKPELLVRRALHAEGFRFRLHVRDLPGRPDLVLPRHRGVVFVHGCFWHGHDCALFRWPATRQEFWEAKISGNRERDARVLRELRSQGWRTGEVWECALKGPERLALDDVTERCAAWLRSEGPRFSVRGKRRRDLRPKS